MDNEKMAYEFEFLREKIKQISRLLINHNTGDLIEAAFMAGCLHSICHQHWDDFYKKHKESQNVDA
jgi:hypothetical protein